MWILTEFIGENENGEELYVFVSRHTLQNEQEAETYNRGFHQSGSNLRYYKADRLPKKIVTEKEALPWRREPVPRKPHPIDKIINTILAKTSTPPQR